LQNGELILHFRLFKHFQAFVFCLLPSMARSSCVIGKPVDDSWQLWLVMGALMSLTMQPGQQLGL
jgi:hypothetical protein